MIGARVVNYVVQVPVLAAGSAQPHNHHDQERDQDEATDGAHEDGQEGLDVLNDGRRHNVVSLFLGIFERVCRDPGHVTGALLVECEKLNAIIDARLQSLDLEGGNSVRTVKESQIT